MNKQARTFTVLIMCLITVLLWWLSGAFLQHGTSTVVPLKTVGGKTNQQSQSNIGLNLPPTNDVPPFDNTKVNTSLSGIRLFKSTNYPPQTSQEKALWEWWDTNIKSEPDFRWKMPIDFFGKVVDQYNQPVENATVVFVWTTVVGPTPDPKLRVLSGLDGKFELRGVQGKGISVDVLKMGYLNTSDSFGSFEYADFFQEDFHVPDPNNPVVFRLYKMTGSEPMYKYFPNGDLGVGGEPLKLNIETGKVAPTGDLAFSIFVGSARGRYGPDYTIIVEGLQNAGCISSDEEMLFAAPETGYEKTLKFTQKVEDPNYSTLKKLRFYIKTSAGRYAAAEIEINLLRNLKMADFHGILYYNPSGSRNLEFDSWKQINR